MVKRQTARYSPPPFDCTAIQKTFKNSGFRPDSGWILIQILYHITAAAAAADADADAAAAT
jgi:hypothetical protein